jgi:hypothetical protein
VVVIPALLAWIAAIATLVFGVGCHMIDGRFLDGDGNRFVLGLGPWTVQAYDFNDLYVDDQTLKIAYQTVCVSYYNWYVERRRQGAPT